MSGIALSDHARRGALERPDFETELTDPAGLVVVERPLPWYERVLKNESVQNGAILAALALIWELYARWTDNPLLVPTFTARRFMIVFPSPNSSPTNCSVSPPAARERNCLAAARRRWRPCERN